MWSHWLPSTEALGWVHEMRKDRLERQETEGLGSNPCFHNHPLSRATSCGHNTNDSGTPARITRCAIELTPHPLHAIHYILGVSCPPWVQAPKSHSKHSDENTLLIATRQRSKESWGGANLDKGTGKSDGNSEVTWSWSGSGGNSCSSMHSVPFILFQASEQVVRGTMRIGSLFSGCC